MLYWPFWKQDGMPNDRYGTVGTGLGAGTGAGTVQVRYGYGTGTIHGYGRYGTWVRFSYPCTVPTVPVPCTQIAAEIVADLLLFLPLFGYMVRISAAMWVHGTGTVGTVHGYENRTHVPYRPYPCIVPVPYPYRTVPAPVPANKPVPTVPYPSKLFSKNPSAPYVMNPIENRVFIALEIS